VTGASRGLGAAIAARLAAAGHPVAVNYASSGAAAEAVVEGIRATGGVACAYRADITDEHEAARMVEDVRGDLGPVGVLVLNATGPQPAIPDGEVRWPDMRAQLDFFVKSPVLLLGSVLPDMRAAGGADRPHRVRLGARPAEGQHRLRHREVGAARAGADVGGRARPVRHHRVPDDVAGAVAYLVSEDASFVNGAWLTVNGGSVAG
jgi:3-oxoacyl-[acyl-carrier protein] reductase